MALPSTRLPLEQAALGLLMTGARHGYELHKAFVEQFGDTWHAGRSQFYAALKALEAEGLAHTEIVPQEGRPPRKVLAITPAGRQAFLAWLRTPVPHVRDVRVEFLARLRLFRCLALDGVDQLIDAQIGVCRERLRRIEAGVEDLPQDLFSELVDDFRRRQIEAVIAWLEECRRRMA